MDKVAVGQVFSEYFGFPCQFPFHRLLHTHHLSSAAGTIGQMVADVQSGLSLTPPQETKKKKNFDTFVTNQFVLLSLNMHHWFQHQPDNLLTTVLKSSVFITVFAEH
jgi:hypothetical protein